MSWCVYLSKYLRDDELPPELLVTNHNGSIEQVYVPDRTCHPIGADEHAIEHNVDGSYKCPRCGCVVDYDIRGDNERIITMDDYVIPFNFCPSCGAEVVCE